MIWVVVPAVPDVPEPGLVPQTEEAIHQDASVEHPSETIRTYSTELVPQTEEAIHQDASVEHPYETIRTYSTELVPQTEEAIHQEGRTSR